MKLQVAALFASALATAAVAEEPVSYDGSKVFRIEVNDDVASLHEKLEALNAIELTVAPSDHLDVVISQDDVDAFDLLGLDAILLSDDLGAEIAEEGPVEPFFSDENASTLEARQSALPALTWFDAYRPYADHAQFFSQLQAAFPSNSRIFNVGNSHQGRTIYGLHMWGPNGQGSRPAIYFHGTVHAREWITAPVVEYIARQLIEGYRNNDALIRSFFDRFDFYFVPFVNPDGFVYSQSTDRLWRKNRQPRSGTTCVGTDGNRNWNYQWSVSGGASTNPCAETYRGLAAGDTPEIRALQTFTSGLRTRGIKLFIDWHSYGQYILLPYGYSCSARASNHDRQMSVANGYASRMLSVGGTRWTVGPSCSTLYASTGSAPDYMSGAAGAEFAWTVELRPGSGSGSSGFVLPANQIRPSAVEQWEGLKYVLGQV